MTMSPLDPRDVLALGWSLLHFVWQGTVVAALFGSVNLLLRRASPQARYVLASAALAFMLLLPVATFGVLRGPAPRATSGPVADEAGRNGAPNPVASVAAMDQRSEVRGAARAVRARLEPLLPALVGVWGTGALLLSLRSLGGWALVQRLRRRGLSAPPAVLGETLARLVASLSVSAPVRLYESALVGVPTVVGWLRPVVLIPASAMTGLSAQQMELILAHELAHIRRGDYLVNLLQTAVETLLFYHPAVWWVSHRMRVEREHCCDDLAVAACGSPRHYARALADLQGLCSEPPALAMAATGGSLFDRVARLVGPPPHVPRSSRLLAALLAVASSAVALGVGASLVASPAHPVLLTLGTVMPTEVRAGSPTPTPDPAARSSEEAAPKPRPGAEPRPEPRAFPLERILELARAGVTPEYIDELEALGYRSLSADQLIALRSQGVRPDDVRELAAAGYRDLTPDQLLALRAQGVSASYARALKEQGLEGLSLSDLLALRAQGVSAEFVGEMKEAGYGDLTPGKLMALRSQGVSGAYVQELKALGYDKMSLSKLIALRSQGVTPHYVRGLADLGYQGLELPMLLGLRSQGVTAAYIRGLKEAGYEGLPAGLLIELRSQGVTPDFVREVKEAGFDKLKPEELIELRSQGVHGDLLKRLRGRQ